MAKRMEDEQKEEGNAEVKWQSKAPVLPPAFLPVSCGPEGKSQGGAYPRGKMTKISSGKAKNFTTVINSNRSKQRQPTSSLDPSKEGSDSDHRVETCNVLEDDFEESENEAPQGIGSMISTSSEQVSVASAPASAHSKESPVALGGVSQASPATRDALNDSPMSTNAPPVVAHTCHKFKSTNSSFWTFPPTNSISRNKSSGRLVLVPSAFVHCFLCNKVVSQSDLPLHVLRNHNCGPCDGVFADIVLHKSEAKSKALREPKKKKLALRYHFRFMKSHYLYLYAKEKSGQLVCCVICFLWMPAYQLRNHVVQHFCHKCEGFFSSLSLHSDGCRDRMILSHKFCQRETQTDGEFHDKISREEEEASVSSSDSSLSSDVLFNAISPKDFVTRNVGAQTDRRSSKDTTVPPGPPSSSLSPKPTTNPQSLDDPTPPVPPPSSSLPPKPAPNPQSFLKTLDGVLEKCPAYKPKKLECVHCSEKSPYIVKSEKLMSAHLRLFHFCPLPACDGLLFRHKKTKKDHLLSGHKKYGERIEPLSDSSSKDVSSSSSPVGLANEEDEAPITDVIDQQREIDLSTSENQSGKSFDVWRHAREICCEDDDENEIGPPKGKAGKGKAGKSPSSKNHGKRPSEESNRDDCRNLTNKTTRLASRIDLADKASENSIDRRVKDIVSSTHLDKGVNQPSKKNSTSSPRTTTHLFSCTNCSVAKKCANCKERLEAFEQDFLRSAGVVPAPQQKGKGSLKKARVGKHRNDAGRKEIPAQDGTKGKGQKRVTMECNVEGCLFQCRCVCLFK